MNSNQIELNRQHNSIALSILAVDICKHMCWAACWVLAPLGTFLDDSTSTWLRRCVDGGHPFVVCSSRSARKHRNDNAASGSRTTALSAKEAADGDAGGYAAGAATAAAGTGGAASACAAVGAASAAGAAVAIATAFQHESYQKTIRRLFFGGVFEAYPSSACSPSRAYGCVREFNRIKSN